MSSKKMIILVVFAMLSFIYPSFVSLSFASTDEYLLCFDYDIEFDLTAYGDYYTSNLTADSPSAHGIYVSVYKMMGQLGQLVWEGHTSTATGCVSLELESGSTHSIKMQALSLFSSSNRVRTMDNETDWNTHVQWITGYTPLPAYNTATFLYNWESTYQTSNTMAAASRSILWRNAGMSGS